MNYSIHITDKAERDLNEAADYIEFTLLNPEAADHLLDKVEEEISNLAFMPEKYKTVDDMGNQADRDKQLPCFLYR